MTEQEYNRRMLDANGRPRRLCVYDAGGGFKWFCGSCFRFTDVGPVCPACGGKIEPVGVKNATPDRYTIVYDFPMVRWGSRRRVKPWWPAVSFNAWPDHPQHGVWMHFEMEDRPDYDDGHPVSPGVLCPHVTFGYRIRFEDLPDACRKLALEDYRALCCVGEPRS